LIIKKAKILVKTGCHGQQCYCGTIGLEDPTPEGLTTYELDVLDPEDDTGVYILGWPTILTSLTSEEIVAIQDGETARRAKGKLTDTELSSLGLTRD